jgi:hypothetical protein
MPEIDILLYEFRAPLSLQRCGLDVVGAGELPEGAVVPCAVK